MPSKTADAIRAREQAAKPAPKKAAPKKVEKVDAPPGE